MEITSWAIVFVACITLIVSLAGWLLVRSIFHKLKKRPPKAMRRRSGVIIGSLLLLSIGGFIALLFVPEAMNAPESERYDLLIGLAVIVICVLGIISLSWLAFHRRKSFYVALVGVGLVLAFLTFLFTAPLQESWEQIEARDFAYADEQGWTTLISTNVAGEQRYYRKEGGQWVRMASEAEMAYIKPCSQPLSYTIASIDPRFGISEEKLLNVIKEAEAVWEKASGLDLLVYKEDSAIIKINMLFDDRQQKIFDEIESSNRLNTQWASYNSLLASYEANVALHNADVQKFEKAIMEFNARDEAYGKRVQQWEDNPTTQEEYDYLVGEYNAIQDISAELSAWNDIINERAADLNRTQAELNTLWQQLNFKTYTHNTEFTQEEMIAGWHEEYIIDIYWFYNIPGLRVTLAHEFGHALGIGHLENSLSIMYPTGGVQNMISLKPSEEDLAALSSICGITK